MSQGPGGISSSSAATGESREHDPSFQVDLNRKTWRCWVCAIGGDAAELVKKVNKCGFPTVVKFLADRAGVASPWRGATGPAACWGGPPTPARGPASIVSKPAHSVPGARPPDEPSGLSWEKRRPSLTRPPPASGDVEGGTALDYLRGRGLTEATVRAAGLGFTPAVMIPTRAGDRCFRFSGTVIPWRAGRPRRAGGTPPGSARNTVRHGICATSRVNDATCLSIRCYDL